VNGNRNLTDYERKILANVDKYGCHVTYVFDNGDDPDFSYSTGFTRTLNQGEVIVFGLPREVMHSMVNRTMEQCLGGLILNDFVQISGLLEGFDVIARTVLPQRIERQFFNSAMWFHRREFASELTVAYQLVWPSAVNGLFPWDESCPKTVIDLQPPLYKPEVVH